MTLTGARLLVAAALFFPSVSPSPIFEAGQKVLDAITGARDSIETTPHIQQPSRKLKGKFLHLTGTLQYTGTSLWILHIHGMNWWYIKVAFTKTKPTDNCDSRFPPR